jgi:hypothetical protein
MLFNVVFLCSTALAVSAAGNEWQAPTSSDREYIAFTTKTI